MSIRNKLMLMLVIPLVALALVAALGFRSQSGSAQDADEAFSQDAVVQSINRSVKAVGAERLALATGADVDALDEARVAADLALDDVLVTAAAADLTGTVAPDVAEARAELNDARDLADFGQALPRLNEITDGLRDLRNVIDVPYPNADALADATSVNLAVDVADLRDAVWLEYIEADGISDELAARFTAGLAQADALREQVTLVVSDRYAPTLNAALAGSVEQELSASAVAAGERIVSGRAALPDAATLDAVVASHLEWYGHATTLQDDVAAGLSGDAAEAGDRQALFALMATLGMLVLFGLVYVIYRSVVRPLNELLEGADDVATHRLPAMVAGLRDLGSSDEVSLEPLPKETDDELGSLVDAFNDVQLTAFDLAVEQARSRRNIAEMFVNLGRRNQKLLQRMLVVISDLERDETDPDTLEALFRLDHMTTRMRRNAESLLVLAGTKTPRQWNRPVPVADVIRGALGEVEDYQRVDLGAINDVPMGGGVVADVTHLIAELLENSLQFSEPETRVEVSSRWKDGVYRISISDQGFGMTDDELAANNSRISDPPSIDQAPTRFLGLFVVGHLANRHGIDVQLFDAPLGGTITRISIPGQVLVDETSPEERPLEQPADLDAELAGLTDAALPVRGHDGASIDDLGDDLGDDWLDEPAVPAAAPTPDFGDLPVRGSEAEPEPEAVDTLDLPVRGAEPEAEPESEPVDTLDLPVRGAEPEPAPEVEPEPAAEVEPEPVAEPEPAADVESAPLDDFGLPQRKPMEALGESAPTPVLATAGAPNKPKADAAATASAVGSMFSAFQSGVQRGEAETDDDGADTSSSTHSDTEGKN